MLTYALEKGFTLPGQVESVAFSPNGLYLAVAMNSQVSIWDTTTWSLDLCFRRDTVPIRSVTWDSRNRLFFGCDEGLLTVVSFDDDKVLEIC